ncbi:MAG: exodeoxyribonuclease VII large subunit [Thermoleophilia bacterium]|nr:exodeoxyribonuclease VII large subunit [Thermoleophilia bacterium]
MAWGDDDIYEGATEPLWYGERKVWSVTGFTLGVRSRIVDIPSLWVEGEISELKVPRPGQSLRTVFFTLKDPNNGWMVSATMPKARFEALKLDLRDGDLVQCFGRPDIYQQRGTFQLRVQGMEHAGRGLILQQLEALKAKLQAEGLFDESRKRPLPFLPRRVGVITGAGAAAQGDFLRNVYERFPPVKLVMCETLVQGERAAPMLVAALRKMQQIEDVDVIVITRGGGAFEDFLPFSDERLCRAIAACPKPVVSAIGHEKDSPISDNVADLRVSTPTAAARTVVPDYAELTGRLTRAQQSMRRRGSDHVRLRGERIAMLRARLADRSPARFVEERRRWIEAVRDRARATMDQRIEVARTAIDRDRRDLRRVLRVRLDERGARLTAAVGRLRALSPTAVVERGYAIVRGADGRVVQGVGDVAAGDQVQVAVAHGTLHATVDEVEAATGAKAGR